MPTLVGTLLNGRYRLDAKVGAGGMSTVYRAFDMTLERVVAVKLMHREIAADSDHLERFRREARSVAQLSHPHIVTVIDQAEDQGRPYIVFEYVEGETLKDRIRRNGRLSVGESVAYAIEIARALGCAHQGQIVHRDVKPQNVLIDTEGSAKVTDFGIARTLDEEGITVDGRVLGTTDYVSPEQAMGQSVTGQSDLYSLGVVLYEMLTGTVPFTGENQVAVAMKHVRESLPDIQTRRPEISSALAAVLDRATSKDPARRYADDAELIADLEDVLAIEAARAGGATGEATAVLRTLPERAQRRLPLRMRMRVSVWGVVGAVILALAVVMVGAIVARERTHRGTGIAGARASPGLRAISLAANAAHDYDPHGGNGSENPQQTPFAIDRDLNTSWSTETYPGGNLPKIGVGIYIDSAPGIAARALELSTPTPGFRAEIYAAKTGPPASLPDPGWIRLTSQSTVRSRQRFTLDTAGQPFRYYLIWITHLPPSQDHASIAEIYLYA